VFFLVDASLVSVQLIAWKDSSPKLYLCQVAHLTVLIHSPQQRLSAVSTVHQ